MKKQGEIITIEQLNTLRKQKRVGQARHRNKDGDKGKAYILKALIKYSYYPVLHGDTELQFAPPRKFRFDYCVPELWLAIEYEGISGSKTGKSGHVTSIGYTSNCEKYNLATTLGWRVLRYTALNYKQVDQDLARL